MRQLDLNADIGEGWDDSALLPLLSSANIACGFHAGDRRTMAASIALCLRSGVAIGAHPSYPDREGFGRRDIVLSHDEIRAAVTVQVSSLAEAARAAGTRLAHVKPHGALYNRAAVDADTAAAVAQAVHALDPALALVGLAGSLLLEAGRARGLRVLAEGFADRRYRADGTLVPRGDPRALIDEPAQATAQVLDMLERGEVRAEGGARVAIAVDTVCLHGDGAHALEFALALRAALLGAGVEVRAPRR